MRKHPSVYRIFNKSDDLLYVGYSGDVIRRLDDWSAAPWYREIAKVSVTHFDTRENGLLAERIAILNERPKYNTDPRNGPVDVEYFPYFGA